MNIAPRPVGSSGLAVGPLGLGCWPLAGMTRSGITPAAAVATVAAALDAGIVHLDTAYCYGEAGESERAIAQAMAGRRRDTAVIASKCGIHWEPGRKQCVDGRPERISREVEESLGRLGTDHVDMLYLHAPDPMISIEESAAELARLLAAGKTRAVGVSNVSREQLERFASACPLSACQMHYNMLQREIEAEILPWCRDRGVAMFVYWPLMKGLLAGGMTRDLVFPTTDSRHKYPMFNGTEFQRNLDFVEALRPVAHRLGCTLPDMVLAWTAEQPGITCVLFGATSPEQVGTDAHALTCELDDDARAAIAGAIRDRGPVANRRAV
jgi:aryl-alcohol dehydrogenase-like predicted oxidoreductase